MTESRTRFSTWAPRVLLILFALFLTVFSLDVIEEGKSAGEIAMGLLVHNLPSMLLLAVLALAWRWARCTSPGPGAPSRSRSTSRSRAHCSLSLGCTRSVGAIARNRAEPEAIYPSPGIRVACQATARQRPSSLAKVPVLK